MGNTMSYFVSFSLVLDGIDWDHVYIWAFAA